MKLDLATLADGTAGPGQDTRQWVSFGLVDEEDGDNKPVTFDSELGPLVNVTLQPSGIGVRCRVAAFVAGAGEGEWNPFIPRDEVLVLVPEGDERAGCTIVGRMNNGLDQWPKQVAGNDATQNTFGFRRTRVPYIFETQSSYLLRSSTTGAMLSISADGKLTLAGGDKSFLAINPDFIGMQSADGAVLLQLVQAKKLMVLNADGTQLLLGKSASHLLTKGTLSLGTLGNTPLMHAATVEGVVNLLFNVLSQLGAVQLFPWTPAQVTAALAAGLPLAAAAPLQAPVLAALKAALLASPQNDTTGTKPGVGSPGLLIS